MYATPGQLDREQYLLGKAVDKHVDPLSNEGKEVWNPDEYIATIFQYFKVKYEYNSS